MANRFDTEFRITLTALTYTGHFNATGSYTPWIGCESTLDGHAAALASASVGVSQDVDVCDDWEIYNSDPASCNYDDPPTCAGTTISGVTPVAGRVGAYDCHECGEGGIWSEPAYAALSHPYITNMGVDCKFDVNFWIYFQPGYSVCSPEAPLDAIDPPLPPLITIGVLIEDVGPYGSDEAMIEAALDLMPGSYPFSLTNWSGTLTVERL